MRFISVEINRANLGFRVLGSGFKHLKNLAVKALVDYRTHVVLHDRTPVLSKQTARIHAYFSLLKGVSLLLSISPVFSAHLVNRFPVWRTHRFHSIFDSPVLLAISHSPLHSPLIVCLIRCSAFDVQCSMFALPSCLFPPSPLTTHHLPLTTYHSSFIIHPNPDSGGVSNS